MSGEIEMVVLKGGPRDGISVNTMSDNDCLIYETVEFSTVDSENRLIVHDPPKGTKFIYERRDGEPIFDFVGSRSFDVFRDE